MKVAFYQRDIKSYKLRNSNVYMPSADCEAAVRDWYVRGPLQCWGRARHQLRHVSPGAAATCLPPYVDYSPPVSRLLLRPSWSSCCWGRLGLAAPCPGCQTRPPSARPRRRGGRPSASTRWVLKGEARVIIS